MDAPSTRDLDRALAPILAELLTPALVVDLDAVEHNVAAMLAHVGDPRRWRPHLKTVKQRVVIELLLAHGLAHFKVATPDELALVLACGEARAIDVLFAHPATPPSFRVTRALAAEHPRARVQWLVDSPTHAVQLARAAEGAPLEVQLDVDLGMARTGTPPAIWRAWLDSGEVPAELAITGLHGYDGHLRWHERERAHAGYDALIELARAIVRPDRPDLQIVSSGTHAYAHALAHAGLREGPWLHQVSPGTIVLCDLRSREAAEQLGLRQAAFVAARVISLGAGRATLDAGSKSITPDGEPPVCAVLDHPELTPLRASEEHLPCRLAPDAAPPELGSLVWLVPDHVCTTVNLHREAIWIRGDRLVGRGPVVSGHRCSAPESGDLLLSARAPQA
ncbi:alanine racemase [Nannocystaceae bacterium ST9]